MSLSPITRRMLSILIILYISWGGNVHIPQRSSDVNKSLHWLLHFQNRFKRNCWHLLVWITKYSIYSFNSQIKSKALVSFSDAGRKGNSVEISRNKPILSHLVVHLLSIVSCGHRSLQWYLPGTNDSLTVKNTGSTWLWHGAAPPGTEQTHVFCAGHSQAILKISMLTPLRRDAGSRGWGALALQTEGCKHMCSPALRLAAILSPSILMHGQVF